MNKRQARILELQRERATMVAYLAAKAHAEDWHGVADAANDLREIDRELRVLRSG